MAKIFSICDFVIEFVQCANVVVVCVGIWRTSIFLYLAYVNLIVETTFRKQMFKQWSLAATDKSPPNFNSIHR